MKKCKEENCGGPHKARGLCHKHYQRLLATGVERIRKLTGTLEERFHRCYVVNEDTGCHEWTYSMHVHGYPVLCFSNKNLAGHRVAYEIYNGPISAGLCVCHRCDNPRCVNPDHLFLGTNSENLHDMHRKGRARTKVMSREKKLEMFYLYHVDGKAVPFLAARYAVTHGAIIASLYRFRRKLERTLSPTRKRPAS